MKDARLATCTCSYGCDRCNFYGSAVKYQPTYITRGQEMSLGESIQFQLANNAGGPITIHHAGGTVTLTPAQGRAVLAGGELVVDAMGVRVK